METQPFSANGMTRARVLVVGHDPRLQRSPTLATFALFADYYFRSAPVHTAERRKHRLASATFECVDYLTGGLYDPKEVAITNLCNQPLPPTSGRGTVLIPELLARAGAAAIERIIRAAPIELIFAMSEQVNYWLQYLGVCERDEAFVKAATPKKTGVETVPPYYVPTSPRAFQQICGRQFSLTAPDLASVRLFPILHTKSWLTARTRKTYAASLERCRTTLLS